MTVMPSFETRPAPAAEPGRCGLLCSANYEMSRNSRPASAPATTGVSASGAHDYPPSTWNFRRGGVG
jgi:hypothetical protein